MTENIRLNEGNRRTLVKTGAELVSWLTHTTDPGNRNQSSNRCIPILLYRISYLKGNKYIAVALCLKTRRGHSSVCPFLGHYHSTFGNGHSSGTLLEESVHDEHGELTGNWKTSPPQANMKSTDLPTEW